MNEREEKLQEIRSYGTMQIEVGESSRISTFSTLDSSSIPFEGTSQASSKENLIAVS